jgi:hypothetical protein
MFDKLFDMSNMDNLFSTLTVAANQKAEAAKKTAEVAVEQKGVIADSAAQYGQEARNALLRVEKVEGAGAEARRMAESNNILDRISLIGDQIINPRDFTLEGRQKQIGEISQTLAMRGQIHNIEVNEAQANIDKAVALEVQATAGVDARMSAMRAQIDGLALMNNALVQTESLRTNALVQMDLPTLQKSQAGPAGPNGKIAINGMLYAPAELQEREKQLRTRDALAALAPSALGPEYAQQLGIQQDLVMQHMQLPELEEIRLNNYTMPDGTKLVNTQIWDAHYDRLNKLQEDNFRKMQGQMVMDTQIPMMIEQSAAMSKNVAMAAAPGTPLASANAEFLAVTNSAAAVSAIPGATPEVKIKQVQLISSAQEKLNKAVENEAMRKAGGDRELASIYRSQILGEPINPAQVEDVARSRYIANKGFADIFPSEVSTRLRKTADSIFEQKQLDAAKNMNVMGPEKTQKELKDEAVTEAFEVERRESGFIGINRIQEAASKRTDSPAYKAGLIPAALSETMDRATLEARKQVKDELGLNDDQLRGIVNGTPQTAGVSPETYGTAIQLINQRALMNEYDMLEQYKRGLGYEMQQWYGRVLPEMARNYTESLPDMQKVMVGDQVLVQAQKFNYQYTEADNTATQRGLDLIKQTATEAQTPENMWPVLL